MGVRNRLYVAAVVGAMVAYLFATIARTGELHLLWFGVFIVVFVVVTVLFEWFIGWTDRNDLP